MNSPKYLGRDPESRSEIDSKRKITIAWNWRPKNQYAGNRSWRKIGLWLRTLSLYTRWLHALQLLTCYNSMEINVSDIACTIILAYFILFYLCYLSGSEEILDSRTARKSSWCLKIYQQHINLRPLVPIHESECFFYRAAQAPLCGENTWHAWWRHQMKTFSALLPPFVQRIHRSPVNSPHKGQWHGALMFSLICAWTNGWVNNRYTGALRHHRAHYDGFVMLWSSDIMLLDRHDDVIKWKHFPRYWPFVRGIPRTKASDTELWCFVFYLRLNNRLSKQSWGWWFETLSRPLWRHHNGTQSRQHCVCR